MSDIPIILSAAFNLNKAILNLHPNAQQVQDYLVQYDGTKYNLLMWNLSKNVPSLEELKQAYVSYVDSEPVVNLPVEQRISTLEEVVNTLLLT
jgi:XkdW protein